MNRAAGLLALLREEADMCRKLLRLGALLSVLAAPLGACMQNAPANSTQAQYLSELRPCQPGMHPISFPNNAQGYRCVYD